MRHAALLALSVCSFTLARGLAGTQQGRTVHDHEPNNSAATATSAAIGDTIVGVLTPLGDSDFFAFDVPAGTEIRLATRSSENFLIYFADTDGRTYVTGLGGDHPNDTPTPYPITTAGRYYVRVGPRGSSNPTPDNQAYWLTIESAPLTLGPGDPFTVFATDTLENYGPFAIAAAGKGDFYVLNGSYSFAHVTAEGAFTTLASNFAGSSVAVDGYGDALVAGPDVGGDYAMVLWRFSPAGQKTPFTPSAIRGAFYGLTIGPDGDVWAGAAARTGQSSQYIWRFDPQGRVKDSISIATYDGVYALAFSPAGDLHFITASGVYRLHSDGARDVVIPESPGPEVRDIAFDRDGYLYVLRAWTVDHFNRVALYDPTYHIVRDTFATVQGASRLAFARDANGAMTNRLLATQITTRRIIELNRAGVRAPGWRIGTVIAPVAVSVDDVSRALLGDGTLNQTASEYLDRQGNHNGQLDVGDLRAFLRARGLLPASSPRSNNP